MKLWYIVPPACERPFDANEGQRPERGEDGSSPIFVKSLNTKPDPYPLVSGSVLGVVGLTLFSLALDRDNLT